MESERIKRKLMLNPSHDEHEENEEEKVEQFFALVKSLREARDRLINGSDALQEMEEAKRKKQKVDESSKVLQICAGNLSFQREDFLQDVHRDHNDQQLKVPAAIDSNLAFPGSSQRSEVDKKEEVKETLDLKLSL